MIRTLLCLVLVDAVAVCAWADDRSDTDGPYHGLAVQVHRGGEAVKEYARLIREVADLGADTVLLSADGSQENIDSIIIDVDLYF